MTKCRFEGPTMNARHINQPRLTRWSTLSPAERDLLTRLTTARRKDGGLVVDGILVTKLTADDRDVADRLLERKLVDYRDLVLRATALGLRIVVLESGIIGRTG